MKVILATAVMMIGACPQASAWASPWNYFDKIELRNHSELVVIATPVSTTEIGDVIPLTGGSDPWMGVGLETRFKVDVELKGSMPGTDFVLHYYRYQSPHEGAMSTGPSLVSFDPKTGRQYLLFLTKGSDGRYVPATRQSDAREAVFVLGDSGNFWFLQHSLADYRTPLPPRHSSWGFAALVMTALAFAGGVVIVNRKPKAPKLTSRHESGPV